MSKDDFFERFQRINNAYARRHGFTPPHADLPKDVLADELAAMDLADAEIAVEEMNRGRELL